MISPNINIARNVQEMFLMIINLKLVLYADITIFPFRGRILPLWLRSHPLRAGVPHD